PPPAVRLLDPLFYHTTNDLVRDQPTLVDHAPRRQSLGAVSVHSLAKHLAGRDMREAEFAGHYLRLRPFSGSRSPQQDHGPWAHLYLLRGVKTRLCVHEYGLSSETLRSASRSTGPPPAAPYPSQLPPQSAG